MAVEIPISVRVDRNENGGPSIEFTLGTGGKNRLIGWIVARDGVHVFRDNTYTAIRFPNPSNGEPQSLSPKAAWIAAENGRYGLAFRPAGETEKSSG